MNFNIGEASNLHIHYILVFTLLVLAVFDDIKSYKISNKITIPFIAAGIILNTVLEGLPGLCDSLLGIATPFILLFILFALKMLGAGDIKLFCAIGSIMGVNFILYNLIYSFLLGGLIALIFMIARKNAYKRFKYLYLYCKRCILSFKIYPYSDGNKKDDSHFRFAYAIACGTIVQLFNENIFSFF